MPLQAPGSHRAGHAKGTQHIGMEMRMDVDDAGTARPARLGALQQRWRGGEGGQPEDHPAARELVGFLHVWLLAAVTVFGRASCRGTPRVSGRKSSAQTMLTSVNASG